MGWFFFLLMPLIQEAASADFSKPAQQQPKPGEYSSLIEWLFPNLFRGDER